MDNFETYRPLLFSIAYRMLGSAMEAEDMVQEAYLRYRDTPPETIRATKAFLCAIVTRLCLDTLKSAREKRERYVGPWLPAPLLTDESAFSDYGAPDDRQEAYESISMAFLVLLESLTPVERAVFLLREVFDYDYPEIAAVIGKEEAACRQLLHRARQRVSERRPRFSSSQEEHRQILERFIQATVAGDVDGLMSLLAEDVVSYSDGGGKAQSAARPVQGRDHVARYFVGISRKMLPGVTGDIAEVNGLPALIMWLNGQALSVLSLEIRDGQISKVLMVVNPEKLAHLIKRQEQKDL
jgi:RNA polymerase sigma-70 factor, ECF subfamily